MKKVLVLIAVLALVLPAAQSAMASSGTVHIVQRGQTLMGIARWYGVDYLTLARTNGITNPNRIYVGQRLVIPSSGGGVVTPGTVYTVQRGDTLYGIAHRAGVSVWAIAQANTIYDLTRIYVGQRLVIPGAQPAPAPTPKPAPTTAPAPTSGWRGEYYAGTSPAGAPCLVRYDSAINFRWGTGGPASCVGSDHFSVRWARTINFKGGVYRFTTVVDDGVRMLIDGVVVLDAWKIQPETRYDVDVTLTPGSHTVTVEYFEHTGVATAQLTFVRLGDASVVVPTPTPPPTATPPVSTWSAWYGEYFNNMTLSGPPAATRWDPAIGFEWGTGVPIGGVREDRFSVRWTRHASFYADNYAFCAMSDDGVRMYFDGHLILDEWHASNAVAYCTEIDVTAGTHEVKVEYYEDGGNALIYVWWERR